MANITRRAAVLAAAGTAAASTLGRSAASGRPEGGYKVAVVGAGWFGKLDAQALMQTAPVARVAFADVDKEMLVGAAEATLNVERPKRPLAGTPTTYADYREMLAAEQPDIVLIDTPDHWHALPMIAAMEAGAHVYLQKPIGVDIAEGAAMVAAAAARPEQVVQVALQRRTSPHLITAKREVIDAGRLGRVGHVEVFGYFHQRPSDFGPVSEPPVTLNWDAYCGPAPLVPYRPKIHPLDWRAFTAFSNGFTGDIGVHYIDAVRWLLGLGAPNSVSSHGGIYNDPESPATVPDVQLATFEFDDMLVSWTNRVWGRAPNPDYPWGAFIHGANGTLKVSNDRFEFLPLGGDPEVGETVSDLSDFPSEAGMERWRHLLNTTNRHQMADFVRAIEEGALPAAPVDEAHISTTCCILANIADTVGRTLEWDNAAGRIRGDREAQRLTQRPYRRPYQHPGA